MKKEIKKFSIQAYSAFSAAVLIPVISHAQGVYVDIDPDIVIEYDVNAVEYLDLDNNGISDFGFFKTSGEGYISSYYGGTYGYYEWQRIRITVPGENGMLARESFSSSGTWLVMKVLDEGDLISESKSFDSADSAMVYRRREVSSLYAYPIGDWDAEGGAWRNIPEFPDKYLGVRFTDETNCYHYGWIRCAITELNGKLTIKDWAFESKCDVGINAGDKIGDTSIIVNLSEELIPEVMIYNSGKNIYIENSNEQGTLSIFDAQGKQVFAAEIDPAEKMISLQELITGIYLLQFQTDNLEISKKIFVQ